MPRRGSEAAVALVTRARSRHPHALSNRCRTTNPRTSRNLRHIARTRSSCADRRTRSAARTVGPCGLLGSHPYHTPPRQTGESDSLSRKESPTPGAPWPQVRLDSLAPARTRAQMASSLGHATRRRDWSAASRNTRWPSAKFRWGLALAVRGGNRGGAPSDEPPARSGRGADAAYLSRDPHNSKGRDLRRNCLRRAIRGARRCCLQHGCRGGHRARHTSAPPSPRYSGTRAVKRDRCRARDRPQGCGYVPEGAASRRPLSPLGQQSVMPMAGHRAR
eukprot:scaffold8551_cov132-Isochrysis_galbana.AAC.3